MSRILYNNQNYNQNQIQNAVIHVVGSTPSGAKIGQIYFKTGNSVGYIMTANGERPLDPAALSDGSIANTALATNPLARANHTGTQVAATISDFNTAVQATSLSSLAAAVATINAGSQRLTNLATATNATDAVPLSQLQALIQAATEGQSKTKDAVRVYASSNITLSGLQTIDGVALAAGDRVLAANQTTGSQNNIYTAASGAWSIASDCVGNGDWQSGTDTLTLEGATYAGVVWRQTVAQPITIGTTTLTFVAAAKINVVRPDGSTTSQTGNVLSVKYGQGLSNASGSLAIDTSIIPRIYTTTITGDGSTASWTINHNLGKTGVLIQIRGSDGGQDDADTSITSANSITISTSTALASGVALTIIIAG